MITAIVRYKLPLNITRSDCLAHFHKIAPGFGEVKGLLRKHFIWNETGTAGGIYLWESIGDAKAFYQGPWLAGIVTRYGMYPEIEYFETFAITEVKTGEVHYTEAHPDAKGDAA